MTLLKDNNYKEINVALLSLEADIKNKITNFDTSEIDKQLAEINSRIDKINTSGGNTSSEEIEDINSKLNSNSNKIRNLEQNIGDIDTQINGIEQKLSDIFSAENKVTDFNATTNSGIYYWITDAANRPTDYGVLLVNKYDGGDSHSNLWVNQIAYGTNNKIYFRQNINSAGWTEWKAVAFDGEVNAGSANKLNSFASWNDPYDYDSTNGVRVYVYKISMVAWFSSILVQIYDDINYARSRKYFLGLWHVDNYGYNVSVTDLGGAKNNGLKVWFGNDGNVYLQADVYWHSRISFSYIDDVSDVTITKIGSARYGSNTDINGNVLFTPLADPITDCGALRADHMLSSVSREPQILKTDVLYTSSKVVIPIGTPSSLEDGCIWIER